MTRALKPPAPGPSPCRLSVIFSQYDRAKYHGALERLVGLIDRLTVADYDVVVVDNAHPDLPTRRVTERLIHAGGDNSCREFSAFERGLACLEGLGRRSDLYVFVTDAYTAYGDDYLELIDDRVVAAALDLSACIGWMDSFLEDCSLLGFPFHTWMRTSFLFMPSEVLAAIQPLNFSIDRSRLFGATPRQPFLGNAPVSDNLKAFILAWLTRSGPPEVNLEEAWHSRFELDDSTFDLFQDKTLAIFREHLLSARLLAAGVPCYDFRLVRRLAESAGMRQRFSENAEAWQWLGWRSDLRRAEPRWNVEVCELPADKVHGEPQPLRVEGWVVSGPQPDAVSIELSTGRRSGGRPSGGRRSGGRPSGGQRLACEGGLPRPDVAAAFPQYGNQRSGFRLRTDLRHLPPGRYEVTLAIPAPGIRERLGTIHIRPRSA